MPDDNLLLLLLLLLRPHGIVFPGNDQRAALDRVRRVRVGPARDNRDGGREHGSDFSIDYARRDRRDEQFKYLH